MSINLEKLKKPCQPDEISEIFPKLSIDNGSSGENSDQHECAEDKDVTVEQETRRGSDRPKIIRIGKITNITYYALWFREIQRHVPEWRKAMTEKYDSLVANQTWQIAELVACND